jgi:2-methylisocitrate lyase-like PEP mutase family enzyme
VCTTDFCVGRFRRGTQPAPDGEEFEHAGVAAIWIEDKDLSAAQQLGPGEDHEMIGAHEFATKMRAAKQRQRHADSMIMSSWRSQERWSRRV